METMFRTQRMLCDLLRPSLEILSENGSLKRMEYPDPVIKKTLTAKPASTVKDRCSARRRLDALDTASAKLASCKLKQLSSLFSICEYRQLG